MKRNADFRNALGQPDDIFRQVVIDTLTELNCQAEAGSRPVKQFPLRAACAFAAVLVAIVGLAIPVRTHMWEPLTASRVDPVNDPVPEAVNEEQLFNLDPIFCRITAMDGVDPSFAFTIDKGSSEGVKKNQTVVYNGALIGLVTDARDHESTVMTIINPESSIQGIIRNASRSPVAVKGAPDNDPLSGTEPLCRMYDLPADALPCPGDLVVTSADSVAHPEGIPIGTVTETVPSTESGEAYVVIKPLADFSHLEMAYVLRHTPRTLSSSP